jgi:cytosine/adenosine deaminase-related metal-dependent hydrolase
MESIYERVWLDRGEGGFKEFLKLFNPFAKPMSSPKEYIELFNGCNTLFTHLCYASEEEMEMIKDIGSITHCPRSNRILGSKRLEIEKLKEFTLATDGLSSNNSLSLWDEMRAALWVHNSLPLSTLSKTLLLSTTNYPAKAAYLNKGEIKKEKDADIAIYRIKEGVEDLPASLVLFVREAKRVFIEGEEIKV